MTTRANFLYFKKTLREQSGQTCENMKRCSGLHRNMQRLAEMTNPLKYYKPLELSL